jgi:isopenicillin-N epimerase
MLPSLKSLFLLDPDVIFLNHGSFGACPRPVFELYQRWQSELERQPVEFLGRRSGPLLAEARAKLADYVGAEAGEVVYFPNPTTAANMIARSLKLGPGDEVLATDQEYGAMERTWRFNALRAGYSYIRRTVPLPVTTHAEFVERFWAGVTEHTRVIFISHITSPTALIFPVEEICRRARAAGILTIIDGAHAPGQIPLRLRELGVDCYVGAAHKWLCAPKGSAFLYARPEVQSWLMPLVVSWGYESDAPSGSRFIDYHEYQGTRDIAAYLATPAAIAFQAEHDWPTVRADCHALAQEARERLNAITGLEPICPDAPEWFGQMATIRLPPVDCNALKIQLYERYRIEVPVVRWNDEPIVRVSCQAYNSAADIQALAGALEELLKLS